ncbi:hypothetical protein NCS52_00349000 [Fusarium sp. LHS14.1]|nr:hypothetical protein NCS52_00349000 [Fusarium sp. LHS14.1]
MTDSNLPSLANDLNAPDNVNDSNLSESLADIDLDPSSSSEDKRSREESEAAAEETDQSSPPTKRQRRGEEEDEEEMDDENTSEQQEVVQESEENRGDESQQQPEQRILQDDVDNSEDASQRHETAQDDVEIGSSLENNDNSSHPVDSEPYQPVDANIYSPTVSIAEGSMISFEISPGNFDDMPPLVPLDQQQQDAGRISEVSFGGGDADSSAYSAMLVSFLIQAERNRRMNNTRNRRRRRRRSLTPRPEWRTGMPNRPYPRSFITGREYIRRVMSEPNELSDGEN